MEQFEQLEKRVSDLEDQVSEMKGGSDFTFVEAIPDDLAEKIIQSVRKTAKMTGRYPW
ncbi:MAG: hypothetical protein LUE23_05315 [Lachnospiraceae bacterium]|nr:hypothetical protein [Lachnospiraceae bacterium]